MAENADLVEYRRKDKLTADSGLPGDPSISLDKPIYTLSVAAELLDTHPRTLMMYENLGLIKPKRTPTNRRRYSQRDLLRLRAVKVLTRGLGVNLAGAKHILTLLQMLRDHDIKPPAELAHLDVSQLEL